jgi:hypothetical protein
MRQEGFPERTHNPGMAQLTGGEFPLRIDIGIRLCLESPRGPATVFGSHLFWMDLTFSPKTPASLG